MRLREFNSAGTEAFRDFLQQCREGQLPEVPTHLLESEEHTIVAKEEIEVEPQPFVTKRDAAEYLHEKLAPIPSRELRKNAGIWTWLSLQNFDSICPMRSNKRKVRNDYTYIFQPESTLYFYRHLLFISWRILDLAPSHNRLLLESAVDQLDSITDQVMKRLFLTRIPCIFEVLDCIYWDEAENRPYKKVVDPRGNTPGDLRRRFPLRIQQLQKTYDLHSLKADQLVELLGDEFQRYSKSSK